MNTANDLNISHTCISQIKVRSHNATMIHGSHPSFKFITIHQNQRVSSDLLMIAAYGLPNLVGKMHHALNLAVPSVYILP